MRTVWATRSLLQAFAWACALLPFTAFPVLAKNYDYKDVEINQQDSMTHGSNNYNNGSDDSKDEGVRNAMRALNNLAALNIGGAITYGYRGYGNYINSQKMDDLDDRARRLKGTMNSVNNNTVGGGANRAPASAASQGSSVTGNPSKRMSDMDRSFLYRGETSEVAAEFEKRSGMSREELFNHIASAADSGLSWDDPNLLEKVDERYKAFITRVPNKDFRGGIEKAYSMFDAVKRSQIVEEVAAFYNKNRWGTGDDDSAPQQLAASDSKIEASSGAPASGSTEKTESGDRSLAAVTAGGALAQQMKQEASMPKATRDSMGAYLGLGGGATDELNELMAHDDAESIFRLVSKRYRKLTPALIGKAVVLEAK